MSFRFVAAAAVFGPAACAVYTPDLVGGTGPQGVGGAASSAVTTGPTVSVSSGVTATMSSTGTCMTGGCGGDPCPSGGCACDDAAKGASETDVDCGGSSCPPCNDGLDCLAHADCKSGVCAGTCMPSSCSDTAQNGDETSVDCGGSCLTNCAEGQGCASGEDCQSGVCVGSICQPPGCGDGVINGGEACDDANKDPFDACSSTCQSPAGHLLLSEFVVTTDPTEFIEIYNPTAGPIDLTNYWIADYVTYHEVTTMKVPNSNDFVARFPAGQSLAAGAFATISLHSATEFKTAFGAFPTYDFSTPDANAPTMLGTIGSQVSLTNTGEVLMLFYWNGVTSTVQDVDYVAYGSSSDKVDKSAVAGYKPDTPAAQQVTTSAPSSGKSMHRCRTSEDAEKTTGGNGLTGHDETSESGSGSWKLAAKPSPGAPPSVGVCP